MNNRLIYVAVAICICFTYVMVRLSIICSNEEYRKISDSQNISYTNIHKTFANIYDRHLKRLVNETKTTTTVHVENKDVDITEIQRYSDNQLASHIIGYIKDGVGVCGLEADYDDYLRSYSADTGVEIKGNDVLASAPVNIFEGIVTTLDKRIQGICEDKADEYINSGAVVVMNVNNGDILASISRPNFSPNNLYEAINDSDNSPLLNRVNQSYNLGSIFKLVVAATAIEYGYSTDTVFDCKGLVDIDGHSIRCHKLSGHGAVNMKDAMNDSCNCYFINLGMILPSERISWTASMLSFGRIIKYGTNLSTKSGYLPSVSQLDDNIEKANFCFGQGKLSVTPLQVCEMTCAFANDGVMPTARIVLGTSLDGVNIDEETSPKFTKSISKTTANVVKELMISVVEYEGNALAKPKLVSAGGKTATAQTGQYNEDGTEKLNCWFTGFFPSDNPQYAITILSENGSSALSECGACFAEICDEIYKKI